MRPVPPSGPRPGLLLLLSLAFAGWPSASLASATVTFRDGDSPPGYTGTRDVSISDGASVPWNPDTNYNGFPLQIDGDPETSLALMRWDLSPIPAGSTLTAVSLTVDVSDPSIESFSLFECLQPWVDTEATYNQYAAGLGWDAPGASGGGDRGTTALERDPLTGGVGPHTYRLNASGVAVVQRWLDNPAQNHGFIGVPSAGSIDGLHWYDSVDATLSSRPKLTVSYTGAGGPGTVELQNEVSPSAAYLGNTDTVIVQGPDPKTANGDGNGLGVDGSPDLIFALVSFNLSSIPTWATVHSATLTFNVTDVSVGTFTVAEALRPWDESATWNEYRTGSAWAAPGALGAADRDVTVLGSLTPPALGQQSIALNEAGLAVVQGWVSGIRANHGFVLANPAEPDGVALSDREDATPANRPALTVVYTEGQLGLSIAAGSPGGPFPLTVSRQRLDGTPISLLAPALDITLSTTSPTGGFSTNPVPGLPTSPTFTLQIPAGLPSSTLPVYFFDTGAGTPTVMANAGPAWNGASQVVVPVETDGGTPDGGPGIPVHLKVGCGAAGAMPATGLLGLALAAAMWLRRRVR